MTHATKECEYDQSIFHYCDANALLSILENRKLRFTHAAYLNDALEIRHGVGICKRQLEQQQERTATDKVIEKTIQYLEHAEEWHYYVCCFCDSKDKLSQWRAYANDGNGFAIGFHAREFSIGRDGPFEASLRKVTYEENILAAKVGKILQTYNSKKRPDSTSMLPVIEEFISSQIAAQLGNTLIDESVFIKDSGFSEEEEWRAVRSYKLENTRIEKGLLATEKPIRFMQTFQELRKEFIERRLIRPGRYGITPYIEVQFHPESIREIVCGPRTTTKLTETSLEMIKEKYELSFAISRSAATYR